MISPFTYLRLLTTTFLAALCFGAQAQLELSSGIDMSYPFLLNSSNTKLNYGQISFGLRFGIAYKPENTQFFPILTFQYGRTRLPLADFGENIAALNFNYLNLMANENYVVHFRNSQLFIYGGIGFSSLKSKGITVAGPGGGGMQATIDSTANISSIFPAMNVGFEYVYGESAGKDMYLGMGINFQYILLLADRNSYSVSVAEPGYHFAYLDANLSGNVLSPGFYIALHYMLHIKKKSPLYL